jgi:hypothetical protein
MRFRNQGRVAALEFDSQSEFTDWVVARGERAGARFPGEAQTVGSIGPTSVSRIVLEDDTQMDPALEKLRAKLGDDVVAFRMPLKRDFSVVQVEVRDPHTSIVHQFNVGRAQEFALVDDWRPVAAPPQLPSVEREADSAFAYQTLGRSTRFTVSVVPQAELKSARSLFAGYCPRCDGLLERTGLKVEEHDNQTTLWEQHCLDCDLRLLGWKKGDGVVPPGWRSPAPA